MKTQSEIIELKANVKRKIDEFGEAAREIDKQAYPLQFEHYDREYAKAVAQYNILIEVLA